MSALGRSFGFEVKVFKLTPGPHRMKACKPGEGTVACGMSNDECTARSRLYGSSALTSYCMVTGRGDLEPAKRIFQSYFLMRDEIVSEEGV